MQQLFDVCGATLTTTNERRDVSERLRELIEKVFPTKGRYNALEEASTISATRWKNFYYRKQQATDEMLAFWTSTYPNDETYVLTGIRHPEEGTFPFHTKAPRKWKGQTIGDRLVWVITEWASPQGDALFRYLEQTTDGRISAAEWARVIMRQAEPTVDMIVHVCTYRPHFTEWVVTGRTTGTPSIDPTSQESVDQWEPYWKEKLTKPTKALKTAGKDSPQKT